MAERVGFEPTLPVRVNTLSKRAPSATRPSLQRLIRIASAGMVDEESAGAVAMALGSGFAYFVSGWPDIDLDGEGSCVLFILLCSVLG